VPTARKRGGGHKKGQRSIVIKDRGGREEMSMQTFGTKTHKVMGDTRSKEQGEKNKKEAQHQPWGRGGKNRAGKSHRGNAAGRTRQRADTGPGSQEHEKKPGRQNARVKEGAPSQSDRPGRGRCWEKTEKRRHQVEAGTGEPTRKKSQKKTTRVGDRKTK